MKNRKENNTSGNWMTLNLVIQLLLLFISGGVFSQIPYCSWVKDVPNGKTRGVWLEPTDFGNYYALGYITGGFGDITISTIDGDETITPTGSNSCLIEKYNDEGDILWVKAILSTGQVLGNAVVTDEFENLYVVGYFNGTCDFDPGTGTSNITSNGTEIFVLKLDLNGNFIWVKNLEAISGSSNSMANAVVADTNGDIVIAGEFDGSVDFDPSGSTNVKNAAGSTDVFVLKMDALGNLVWVKIFEGSSLDNCFSACTDTSNNIYLTGRFHGTVDFDPGAGTNYHSDVTSFGDVFSVKLNSNGDLVWVNTIGGDMNDFGEAITVDSSGNVYTYGRFRNTVDFNPGVAVNEVTSAGNQDAFIQKVDTDGNFIWAKTFGGTSSEIAKSMAVDKDQNLYLCGYFKGTTDLDPSTNSDNYSALGTFNNGFLSVLDSAGNYMWGRMIPSISQVLITDIIVNENNEVLITGEFNDTVDFDPSSGVKQLVSAYGGMFVAKYKMGYIGFEENKPIKHVSIYPNPSDGYQNFYLENDRPTFGTIQLVDTKSRVVKEVYDGVFAEGVNSFTVNLNDLPPGIYFYSVVFDNSEPMYFRTLKN
ncbi:MAG: T9SS type A sorting domain-containing protein [Crocinitomicaceae bacterium]|nr:T9SS type A sorting domain-containing protein [Crocinitomicaceae bacterium]